MSVQILQGDALTVLKTLPDESVNCCVTSPPYWGLRDYGTAKWEGGDVECDHPKPAAHGYAPFKTSTLGPNRDGISETISSHRDETKRQQYAGKCQKCGATRIDKQLGLERTPEEYVAKMVEVFREVRRVLRDDGTLWLNLGDSYNAYNGGAGPSSSISAGAQTEQRPALKSGFGLRSKSLKPKDLVGIPWMVAFALRQPYYTGTIKRLEDRIWLAAMIDGEGCMFIHKRKAGQNNGQGYERKSDTYGAGLEVANCHELIIQRCMEITGRGSICHQDKESRMKNRNQRLYRWNLRSNECRKVIQEIYPFLIGKQHEARLVLGCPSSGPDAEKAHASLINLHNGFPANIDFKPPEPMFQPGFYLRQDIIWAKNNPMPESVTDRCTKSHEYIFLMSKSQRYFYDAAAIAEPLKLSSIVRNKSGWNGNQDRGYVNGPQNHISKYLGTEAAKQASDRNRRSVWTVTTAPFPGAHFATFPPKLIEPCILAGCPAGGTVLDPFGGSGTVGMVAENNGRNSILIELNPKYVEMAKRRTAQQNIFAGLAN